MSAETIAWTPGPTPEATDPGAERREDERTQVSPFIGHKAVVGTTWTPGEQAVTEDYIKNLEDSGVPIGTTELPAATGPTTEAWTPGPSYEVTAAPEASMAGLVGSPNPDLNGGFGAPMPNSVTSPDGFGGNYTPPISGQHL